MEKRYISENRYKKSTKRKRRDVNDIKQRQTIKVVDASINKSKKKTVTKKIKRTKKVKNTKLNNVIICIILIICIAIISRAILKEEGEPFIPIYFAQDENDEVINIGIITNQNLLSSDINHVLIYELNKYYKDMLLEVNEDYSITYKCISKINKISNSEYELFANEDLDMTAKNIKAVIETYMSDENSMYHTKVKNINSVTVVNDNVVNVKLNKDDPYFIYNLDLPLTLQNSKTNYILDNSSINDKLILKRNKKVDKTLPLRITVKGVSDMYEAVEAYKKDEIDLFITDAANVKNILGKYEYNLKTYRNGKTLFLVGNQESKIYQRQEVRKAIAYSIARDNIIKDVLNLKADKIDLPYIYDTVKYKYDVYAAENLLLTNNYVKKNNVYSKIENSKRFNLSMTLIVNKDDALKVSIAESIKNNLSAIGIEIMVDKLSEANLSKRIKNKDYDLLLASVALNTSPNIQFLNEYIYKTDSVQEAINNITSSSVENLPTNIKTLQQELSNSVSVIGVYADVSYIIYAKDMSSIDNTSYTNIFKSILK